ncbi:DUF2254 domain-containing protein [Streptacidiphilus sp. PB12-B1b]|nr:DUF2254 domain-containing protein [Streptacidiphilus sp. PB12-B1b]
MGPHLLHPAPDPLPRSAGRLAHRRLRRRPGRLLLHRRSDRRHRPPRLAGGPGGRRGPAARHAGAAADPATAGLRRHPARPRPAIDHHPRTRHPGHPPHHRPAPGSRRAPAAADAHRHLARAAGGAATGRHRPVARRRSHRPRGHRPARHPGHHPAHRRPLADVHGADLPATAVLDALVTGDERAFDQDPLLAFRLLADIALRALSPAVNDPATAVQALDCLEDLLADPAATRAGSTLHLTGPDGTVRLLIELPAWADYLRTGLDDVIAAATGSPMVLLHLRALLTRLGTGGHERHSPLLATRLSWVETELAARFPTLWREAAGAPPTSSG